MDEPTYNSLSPWCSSDNVLGPHADAQEEELKLLCKYNYNRSLAKALRDQSHEVYGDNNHNHADVSSMRLDVKMWYVRVTACVPCENVVEAPSTLMMVYPARDISIDLDMNGRRIPPSQRASFPMKIQKADTLTRDVHLLEQLGSVESRRHMHNQDGPSLSAIDVSNNLCWESYTYVCTDHLRVCGYNLPFEIYDNHDQLIAYGNLARSATSTFISGGGNNNNNSKAELGGGHMYDFDNNNTSNNFGWVMDCACGINSSSSCSFLAKGQRNHMNNVHSSSSTLDPSSSTMSNSCLILSPSMEIYVAGMCCGHPLVFTSTVRLHVPTTTPCAIRRSRSRSSLSRLNCSLDAIPEVNEELVSQQNDILDLANNLMSKDRQVIDDKEVDGKMSNQAFYNTAFGYGDLYIDDDGDIQEGDLSWFNAGVRVGVGIGLGLCLGLGIGVSLLVQPFKRKLL